MRWLVAALATASVGCGEPAAPWSRFVAGYEIGEEVVFSDGSALAEAIDSAIDRFELQSGLIFGDEHIGVTFVSGVRCRAQNRIVTDDGRCIRGFMQGCARIYVVAENRPLRETSLDHELLHCFLHSTTGFFDRDHESGLWKTAL